VLFDEILLSSRKKKKGQPGRKKRGRLQHLKGTIAQGGCTKRGKENETPFFIRKGYRKGEDEE